MKTCLLWVLMVVGVLSAMGQSKTTGDGTITFEGSVPPGFEVWRDTVSNPNNVWRIGKPQKSGFTAAHSLQRAMVTDTLNSYPVNDTSVFYMSQVASVGWSFRQAAELRGWYFVDSDSLVDFGKIELSPNNGVGWIDLLKDTVYKVFREHLGGGVSEQKAVLTGRSSGWQFFRMYFHRVADSFDVQSGDTVLLRFSFISDGIQTNRDGLMFDDLEFVDFALGINEIVRPFVSTPSPNPASQTIHFTLSAREPDAWRISLYTLHGQKVRSQMLDKGGLYQLPVSDLPAGTYFYTITGERTGQTSGGNVIVAR